MMKNSRKMNFSARSSWAIISSKVSSPVGKYFAPEPSHRLWPAARSRYPASPAIPGSSRRRRATSSGWGGDRQAVSSVTSRTR